jgi:aerobic carbon-monoxide dehydrogenase medium subunit
VLLREVEYVRPGSVEQALEALASHEGARALAGGQTLINVMKARAASPDVLVDLNDLDELRTVSRTGDGGLRIGAMATYAQLLRDADVGEARPIVAEVAAQIADVQVRNRGTIGGNVCSSDPTNHFPPLAAAQGWTMHVRGAGGDRDLTPDEFFLGVYFTAVGPGDLLTAITIPAGGSDGFASVTLGADGTCIASAAVQVRDGEARVALGCVGPAPVTLTAPPEQDAVRETVRGAGLDPPSDVHASADYRRHLAEVCAVRALGQAS